MSSAELASSDGDTEHNHSIVSVCQQQQKFSLIINNSITLSMKGFTNGFTSAIWEMVSCVISVLYLMVTALVQNILHEEHGLIRGSYLKEI